jgi:histidyl-tRNA synthetase
MASDAFQPIQGMSDLAAPEIYLWQMIEAQARRVFCAYQFDELRTPALERTKVFQRSLGDTTDIVQKEMYTFEDRGGRSLTLRPEGTAGAVRALAGQGEAGLNARIYYLGPMFRCEKPQAGRRRQFHQIGVEATGPACAAADVEVIAMQDQFLRAIGLHGATIKVNTRGEAADRKPVADGLRRALEPFRGELCEDCLRRIEKNVLRVLDCKTEACRAVVQQLPPLTEFMSENSRAYLDRVLNGLQELGIDAQPDPGLVRGLDYYVHTVWEITHDALGAQDALAGGGRYEVQIGGRTVPGVGFAMGMERLVSALQNEGVRAETFAPDPVVWLVSLGDAALTANLKRAFRLRAQGVRTGMELEPKSMKAQMRKANRAGAQQVVICGESELEQGVVVLKNMQDGSQETLDPAELEARFSG